MDSETFLIIDFYNAGGEHVHRWSRFVLSGLSVNTAIDGGMNQIALVNDARIARDSTTSWTIEETPKLRLDTLVDGSTRLSIVLTDVRLGALETDQTLASRSNHSDLYNCSQGNLTIFRSGHQHASLRYRPTVS